MRITQSLTLLLYRSSLLRHQLVSHTDLVVQGSKGFPEQQDLLPPISVKKSLTNNWLITQEPNRSFHHTLPACGWRVVFLPY